MIRFPANVPLRRFVFVLFLVRTFFYPSRNSTLTLTPRFWTRLNSLTVPSNLGMDLIREEPYPLFKAPESFHFKTAKQRVETAKEKGAMMDIGHIPHNFSR